MLLKSNKVARSRQNKAAVEIDHVKMEMSKVKKNFLLQVISKTTESVAEYLHSAACIRAFYLWHLTFCMQKWMLKSLIETVS